MGEQREEISVDVRGVRVKIELPASAGDNGRSTPEEIRMARHLDILLFDALEQSALRLLCAEPQLAKSELAERLRVAPDGQLKDQLTRLVRCRVLASGANGYSLRCPAGVPWTDRARDLLAYLDSLPPPAEDAPSPKPGTRPAAFPPP